MGTEHPALAHARAGRLDEALRLLPPGGPLPVAVAWRAGVLLHARGRFDAAASIYERADDATAGEAAEREPAGSPEPADRAQLLAGPAGLSWSRSRGDAPDLPERAALAAEASGDAAAL